MNKTLGMFVFFVLFIIGSVLCACSVIAYMALADNSYQLDEVRSCEYVYKDIRIPVHEFEKQKVITLDTLYKLYDYLQENVEDSHRLDFVHMHPVKVLFFESRRHILSQYFYIEKNVVGQVFEVQYSPDCIVGTRSIFPRNNYLGIWISTEAQISNTYMIEILVHELAHSFGARHGIYVVMKYTTSLRIPKEPDLEDVYYWQFIVHLAYTNQCHLLNQSPQAIHCRDFYDIFH